MPSPLIAAFSSPAEFLEAYQSQIGRGALRLRSDGRSFALFDPCAVLLRVPEEGDFVIDGWVSDMQPEGVTVLLPNIPVEVATLVARLFAARTLPRALSEPARPPLAAAAPSRSRVTASRMPVVSGTGSESGSGSGSAAASAPRAAASVSRPAYRAKPSTASRASAPLTPPSLSSIPAIAVETPKPGSLPAPPVRPPALGGPSSVPGLELILDDETPLELEAAIARAPEEPGDFEPQLPAEERGPANVIAALDALGPTQKLQRALNSGSRDERMALLRDNNKLLHLYVLKNPRISLDEVQAAARMSTLAPDALRFIGEHIEWGQNSTICASLVRNPRMPQELAVRLVERIPMNDVRAIAKGTGRPAIVQAARKRLA